MQPLHEGTQMKETRTIKISEWIRKIQTNYSDYVSNDLSVINNNQKKKMHYIAVVGGLGELWMMPNANNHVLYPQMK